MIALQVMRDYASGNFVIPLWEIVFYVAVMGFYALMRRPRSCLINSFTFTFYWGFMYMLPRAFSSNPMNHTVLVMYVVSGLGIYAVTTMAFLAPAPKRLRATRNTSGGGFL